MVPIAERPPEADDRWVPGHREGGCRSAGRNSAVVMSVERHTRYVLLAALRDEPPSM